MTDWTTDKVMLGYLPTYEAIADTYEAIADELGADLGAADRWRPPFILEIGAADGAGMQMLCDVFNTRHVVGVECEAHRVEQAQAATGCRVIHTTQTDPLLPTAAAGIAEAAHIRLAGDRWPWPGWDLIVDDASHDPVLTPQTLALMWPTVRPGGWYVIEDWNLFDDLHKRGMWQNLWQKIVPWLGGSGALDDIDATTVQHGMIILRKAARDGDPRPHR